MTSIKIHNMSLRRDAEPLCRLLEGKTYMNFEVGMAPAGGSFDVWVSTTRPDISEEELRDMVMGTLVSCALSMGSASVLRAVAEGCDRLEDGDLEDGLVARETDARVLEHFGQVRRGLSHEPKEEVSSGYTKARESGEGRYTWIDGEGHWIYVQDGKTFVAVTGTSLYKDPNGTMFLREVP